MKRRALAASSIAVIAAAVTLLIFWSPADDFWARSVSFSCSYAAPDFDSIVYTRMFYEDGNYSVVLHDLRTGNIRPLSDRQHRTSMVGVSNSEEYAYAALRRNHLMLRTGLVSAGESAELELGDSKTWFTFFPNLTPDGSAFVLRHNGRLHLVGLKSRTLQVFGPFPTLEKAGFTEASVSPDLSGVAAIHRAEGVFSLRVHRSRPIASSTTVRTQESVLMRPRWLPDGSGLTFIERSGNSWRVMEWRAATSSLRPLFEGARFIETAEMHPDRRHLLLTLGDTVEFAGYFTGLHVHLLDLETGDLRQIGV